MTNETERHLKSATIASRPYRVRVLSDEAPTADALTAYDEMNFAIYLSLLHASAEGMGEDQMSQVILGIDPNAEPTRAEKALKSHLDRARWLSESGYRHMLTG